jgi:PAN domain
MRLTLSLLVAMFFSSEAFAYDPGRFTREPNLDRSGDDLRRDVLNADAAVEACEARCLAATGCVAFTFVKKSTTVPQPICWLKKTVPVGYESECCISGVLKR